MTAVERFEAAMARALDALDRAERNSQPHHILDRFEAAYFSALAAYVRAVSKERAA
jgi:hypothetical protein